MICDTCYQSYADIAPSCPYCRAAASLDALAWKTADERLDRGVTEALLARCDAGIDALLARDFGDSITRDELHRVIERIDRSEPSIAELELAFARESAAALDGIALSELVDAGGADVKMVRRGLAFLKTRRWTEALAWWTLQREAAAGQPRRQLLLLVLESFTHRLAGDRQRAADIHAQVIAHPLYRASQGVTRR